MIRIVDLQKVYTTEEVETTALNRVKAYAVNTGEKLPLEHSSVKTLRVYVKRLTVFLAVVALSLVLLVRF